MRRFGSRKPDSGIPTAAGRRLTKSVPVWTTCSSVADRSVLAMMTIGSDGIGASTHGGSRSDTPESLSPSMYLTVVSPRSEKEIDHRLGFASGEG